MLIWSEFPLPDNVGSASLRDGKVQGARQKVSGLQQYNTFRLTIVTGWYCALQSLYTVFSTSPTARSVSGAPCPR